MRSIIERQLGHDDARTFAKLAQEDGSDAQAILRHQMVDDIERSHATLTNPESTLRDQVSAAYTQHQVEEVAKDEGFINEGD